MKTDDLIGMLGADTMPARPLPTVLVAGLLPALAVALAVVWFFLGFRDDLAASVFRTLSLARFLLAGALAVFALRAALTLARPEGAGLLRLRHLALVPAVALTLFVWTYAQTPAEALQMQVTGKTMAVCLTMIPLMSILPVGAVLLTLRQGAPTAPRLASAMAGLAGGGAAALIYATHCTEDSPLFYVTWYGLAIAGVTLVSALIGPRLLRW